MHVISQNIDGGATEADAGASAPVGPSVATPLHKTYDIFFIQQNHSYTYIVYLANPRRSISKASEV